jgi:hypothetical protein
MSRKIQIVLPEPVVLELQGLADSRGEPLATFARQLVRDGVAPAAGGGRVGALAASATKPGSRGGRPRWLEPYGGDSAWRQEMWGDVAALHGRYPRHLEHLHTGWCTDESQAETLYALAVWRADIDDAGQDPREELAFHHQLDAYAQKLRQQGGGVERPWQPGPPPAEW